MENELIDPTITVITDGTRAEHYIVSLPTDMVHFADCKGMEEAARELCEIAVNQVREECSVYRMPCTWTATVITEDISNVWECKIEVIRYSKI